MVGKLAGVCLVLSSLLITACRGPEMHGVVTDEKGKPVSNALIIVMAVKGGRVLMPSKGLTVTSSDSAGDYSLYPGRNGTSVYLITVTDDSYEPATKVLDTKTMLTANFVLRPVVLYQQSYKIGDEVQARDIEWCPARIVNIETGEAGHSYEIEWLSGRGANLILPASHVRPKNAGPIDTRFPCPFMVKKKRPPTL